MLAGLGGLLILVVWMIIVAIQTGQTTGEKVIWALVCFFCGILGSIVFFAVKRQGLVPLLLQLVGWVLCVAGGGLSYSYSYGNLGQ